MSSPATSTSASYAATRHAARAALVTLIFQEEAGAGAGIDAAREDGLGSFTRPPDHLVVSDYNTHDAVGATTSASRLPRGSDLSTEDARVGGGLCNDITGIARAVALDSSAVAVYFPYDRVATTVLFAAGAEGDSPDADRQREMHRQNLILQGAFTGEVSR